MQKTPNPANPWLEIPMCLGVCVLAQAAAVGAALMIVGVIALPLGLVVGGLEALTTDRSAIEIREGF